MKHALFQNVEQMHVMYAIDMRLSYSHILLQTCLQHVLYN